MSESFDILSQIIELKENGYIISDQLEKYKNQREGWNDFIHEIKYIFVGDNPGKKENENGTYFSKEGQTGINIRKFTNDFLKISFDKKVLTLNKSLIYMDSTADLDDTKSNADKSMALVAELINAVKDENSSVEICVFGIDSLKKPYFGTFFGTLKKPYCLYYHPSRRQPITTKQQEEFRTLELEGKEEELFKSYGEKLYSALIDKDLYEAALDEIKNSTNKNR